MYVRPRYHSIDTRSLESDMAMKIFHGFVILISCSVTVTLSMESGKPGKFKLNQDFLLENEPYIILNDVCNGIACAAQCGMDNSCGYAQYSPLSKVCRLVEAVGCGTFATAQGWVVYERVSFDVTDIIIQNGAVLTQNGGQDGNLIYSIDKIYTSRFYANGADAWYQMDFVNAWRVSKVVVTYTRYYAMRLIIDMSGIQFPLSSCKGAGYYAREVCTFKPQRGICWHNTSSMHITKDLDDMSLEIFELLIYSYF